MDTSWCALQAASHDLARTSHMLMRSSHASAISTSALFSNQQLLRTVGSGRRGRPTAEPGWYGATIVHMRPRARDFVMHFDEHGLVDGLELPQDSDIVRLVSELAVDRCRVSIPPAGLHRANVAPGYRWKRRSRQLF